MKEPSKSPDRHSFQKEGYIKRQEEKGEPVNEQYLDFFKQMIDQHNQKFDDPKTHKNNLEYDLLTTDWILEKVRNCDTYAQNLYAALCNNEFQKRDLWPILAEQVWSCTWRYAGGIVSDMRQEGDYINWYCSGIRGGPLGGAEDEAIWDQKGYVGEGTITDEIRDDLFKLNWVILDEDNQC